MTDVLQNMEPEQLNYDTLSKADFERISLLIHDKVGIKLPSTKKLMVEGRLRKHARKQGYFSLEEYCNYIFNENGLSRELVHIVNAVTTNKTDFFRETEHFTYLRNKIVPLILKRHNSSAPCTIKLWSAACSIGAEVYTIAMVMADIAMQTHKLHFRVLGTDVSTEVLSQAKRGVYPKDMIQPVPPFLKSRYFMFGHSNIMQNQVRIVPELRQLVSFINLNLMDQSYPIDRDVDVIFLRNVLIYFEKETQEAVVKRLASHIKPGGFFILSSSESMIGSCLKYKQLAPGVFQNIKGE